MKTFRGFMLGLGVATMCATGCAERPGQKKDDKDKKEADDKADAKKDGDKADAKKADANKD